MKLNGKTILVTGANRGIGEALVREFLKAGVLKIYAAARDPKRLPDFVDNRVVGIALDITDDASVANVATRAKDVDILINNAGVATFSSVISGAEDGIHNDMKTNYFGTLNMIRAFVPVLSQRKEAVIANVISVVGLSAMAAAGGYSASKAALLSATQSARVDLAGTSIRVVGIFPGPIDTDMAKDIQMEKTPPKAVGEAVIAGLIAGSEDIFPDPMSKQVGALWQQSPKALEQQFAARAVA